MAIIFFRIAAGLVAFVSVGFGIPGALGALHYSRSGEVWRLWVGFELPFGPPFGIAAAALIVLGLVNSTSAASWA